MPSLSVSNDKIIELIKSDKPFYISRLGGVETYYAFTWDIFNKTSFDNGGFIHQLQNNAGIYFPINNKNDLLKFMVKYAEQYGEAIQKSDIFVLTSKYEGLPNVLLEALTLKKFVISSNCKTHFSK